MHFSTFPFFCFWLPFHLPPGRGLPPLASVCSCRLRIPVSRRPATTQIAAVAALLPVLQIAQAVIAPARRLREPSAPASRPRNPAATRPAAASLIRLTTPSQFPLPPILARDSCTYT